MKLGSVTELTNAAIAAMGVGILWDSEVRGLCVRRRAPGGPARYGLKYRFEGRQVWLTFEGMHGGVWDPDSARREARKRIGKDPADRDRINGLPTFAAFAERYITDHVAIRLKPATAEKVRPRILKKLVPKFGLKRLDQIRSAEVHPWHSSMSSTPVEGNRCLSLLRHILNAAELWQVINWSKTPGGYNPCRGVKKFPERARRVFLSTAELARLGEALRTLETQGLQGTRYAAVVANPVAANLFRLCLLTGARPGEMKGLRHEWVHADEGVIRLPDSKTGFRAIAMPPAARELYAALPKIKKCPWVFPVRGLEHIINIWDSWSRVRTAAALGDVKPHDLRHTFASVAVAGKESLYMVQMLLGHASPQTTQRYAHLSMDPQQEATGRIAGVIAAALNAPVATAG
jgi:integrase